MHRFTTPDGNAVAAYDFGGDGPPLLLAHATGFHAHVWLPMVEHLRGEFHCYGFDSRGHGDSDPAPDRSYDWNGFATDALAVIDGFGLERPYGVGHSSGGALLLLAEEAAPGTFAGLVLYEPIAAAGPRLLPGNGGALAAGARRRRATFPSFAAAIDNYRGKGPFAAFTEEALRLYVEHGFSLLPDGSVVLKCDPEDEARTYEMAMSHTAYADLDRVRCPVTFVSSEFESPMPLPVLQRFADRLGPLGRALQLDGLGHFGPMSHPQLVADVVTTHLLAGRPT